MTNVSELIRLQEARIARFEDRERCARTPQERNELSLLVLTQKEALRGLRETWRSLPTRPETEQLYFQVLVLRALDVLQEEARCV